MKPLPPSKARIYLKELREIRHRRRLVGLQLEKLQRREEQLVSRLNPKRSKGK